MPTPAPFDSGMLDVGEGNRVHWRASGNPEGRPIALLHGGPGSGLSESAVALFDRERDLIVQFDQRGCGLSTPHAGDHETDLAHNTTDHLVRDIEGLRRHLGVSRWRVFGTSWGCTLALAYAQRHPRRVSGLLLAGVTTTRRREIDWLYRGMAPLFPAEFDRFRAGAPEAARDGDLVAAYHDLLNHPDPATRQKAADDWHDWEAAPILVDPAASRPSRWADPRHRLARARIITRYFHHGAWLEDGQLIRGAGALSGIPGIMVHGRFDLEAPLVTAWELSRAWPGSRLVIVPNAGHSPGSPGMAEAIRAAAERLRAS